MCGICVVWGPAESAGNQRELVLATATEALVPRGPDDTHLRIEYTLNRKTIVLLGFTRLVIQGSNAPEQLQEQPFELNGGRRHVLCNGEIYNAEKIDGHSDCATVAKLLNEWPHDHACRQLDGDFAIVDIDLDAETIVFCRDPYGVRPLYYAGYPDGGGAVASEIKGLPVGALWVRTVLPGTVVRGCISRPEQSFHQTRWHQVPWLKTPTTPNTNDAVRNGLVESVQKRLARATGVAVGACLSGGLDSSLVAAIAAIFLHAEGHVLHTYSVGMEGSEDLHFARLVAEHIGSVHHERLLTAEGCVADIPEVVRAIESFDVTTVRASVGNYNVGALVQEVNRTEGLNVRVVLNGDGADELLGGYLYMQMAPGDAEFEQETTSLLENLHYFDVLRSERCMACHGLESRSPFLDRHLIALVRAIPTDLLRTRVEKNLLRTAFSTTGLLPDEVLWRRKEAFSDGLGGSRNWYEIAKNAASQHGFGSEHPERLWYRQLFLQHYPEVSADAATPHYWLPKFIENFGGDPSARTL